MDYALIAPFGFAAAISILMLAYRRRFVAIAVRSSTRERRCAPLRH